ACPGAAVRRPRARLPARGLLGRPGPGGGPPDDRRAFAGPVQVRLVAVRGHHVPLPGSVHLGQRPAGLGRHAPGRRAGRPAPRVRAMKAGPLLVAGLLSALPWALALAQAVPAIQAPDAAADSRVVFPARVQQGALVIGRVPPGSRVEYGGRVLRTTGYGTVVSGVGRDATGPLRLAGTRPDGSHDEARIAVDPRDWPMERVDGVPPATVDPPPAIAERIRREQARVSAARTRDDDRADFAQRFIRPVEGRISGRFGSGRIYNGKPGAGHSGMDIAAPNGTPVKAPAAGVVTFADPGLYLTGGTVVIDHGHGVSSNFLHLSRIDVAVGDRIEQGQPFAAVGATGRATGPHLHWGMNWFDVRVDPLLVLERP